MKIITPLFIVFSIVFRPIMPILNYVVNYDIISTELCENRDNIEIDCKGKCYLVKELAQTKDTFPKDNKQAGNILPTFSDGFIVKELLYFELLKIQNHKNSDRILYSDSMYYFSLKSKIFHPPLV